MIRFRWAECQLIALRDCCTENEVQKTLLSLPQGLDATYDQIVARIHPRKREAACKLLIWLDCAQRPLTLRELSVVLSEDDRGQFDCGNEPTPVDVAETCLGLTIRLAPHANGTTQKSPHDIHPLSADDFLIFSHSSVRDWIQEARRSSNPIYAPFQHEHTLLATTSLKYILCRSVDDVSPLWDYCARYWVDHARLSATNNVSRLVWALLNNATDRYWLWFPYFTHSLNSFESYSVMRDLHSPLHVACFLHLHSALRKYLNSEETRILARYDASVFLAACTSNFSGGPETIGALLEAGADINGGDLGQDTPLYAASKYGCLDIVRALLAAGVNVRASGGDALQAALCGGRPDIVDMLLTAGANFRGFDKSWYNALRDVGDERRQEFMDIVFAASADRESIEDYFTLALHSATFSGDLGLVRDLLTIVPDVNSRRPFAWTTMCSRTGARGKGFVDNLVTPLAEANKAVGENSTALQNASFRGEQSVVQALLSARANPNAGGGKFGTALVAASFMGHAEIVAALLDAGADNGGISHDSEEAEEFYNVHKQFRQPKVPLVAASSTLR